MTIGWSTDFVVLDAERPAAEQLDRAQKSTAAWVLVEREGGRWRYVFGRRELLDHPHLKKLRDRGARFDEIPLKDALDLHETQSSDQVGNRQAIRQSGDDTAPTTGSRYVEIDAAAQPVAVGGADVTRTRITRAMPPLADAPARPGQLMRAGAEPHSPTASAASVPTDDEGITPIRHPSIEPDGAVVRGAPIALVVDLLRAASATTAGGPLDLGTQAADWDTIDLGITLVSDAIDFDNGGRGVVTIRRNQTSVPARVTGRVRDDVADGAEIEVSAQFWDGTRCSGAAKRRMMVAGGAATAPPAAAQPTQGSMQADPAAEKPDLTIFITLFPGGTPGRMHWRMETPPFDELPPKLDGFIDLGNDTAAEAAAMFKQFANLERGKHRARIEGFGEKLWDRAPAEFRELYWALHDHYQRPLSIQFCSDDPHLPWELMRPYRKDEVHPPLALRHAVARWIGRYQGYLRNRLPNGRMVAIAPHYKSASTQLSLAEATAAKLVEQFGAGRIDGTLAAMRKLLEEPPGEPVALLYFTGHGLFNADAANASAIKLEDGTLAVDEVARREVKLGERCGTLVFFNACEVGATASALGSVGGWADAFASRRFRAFIAPLWAIDEEDASQATEELLTKIVTERAPIGAALRDLRAKYGDVSPTFFSYLLYGDVTAHLTAP